MAIPKKGSRRIVVDGLHYQWLFSRSQEDEWPGASVRVNLADCPSASLWITFPPRFHLDGPIVAISRRTVLPSDVAAGIRAALAAGWIPDRPGRPFVLRVTEDIGNGGGI